MTKNHRFTLLTLATLLALVFSSMQTVPVRADDTLPPPPATEEPVQPPVEVADPATGGEPVVQEPAATEVPVVIEEPAATEPPVLESTQETVTLPEILEQLPEETNLVVLDENGEALPLVTEAAAVVLAAPDPQFCPAGLLAADLGCSPSRTTIADAILDAYAAGVSGTIYVEPGTFTEDVTIDGTSFVSGMAPASFALVGAGSAFTSLDGWLYIVNMNTFTLSGFTIRDVDGSGNPTAVWAEFNTGTMQINDVNVTNGWGNGITVVGQVGDISLSGVTADGNSNEGAVLHNRGSTGSITVTASQFNENGWGQEEGVVYGLSADSSANISLSNVIANGNRGGAALENFFGTGSITVTDSQFNDNEYGIGSVSSGNITFYNVTANGNDYSGAYLDNAWEGSTGSITIIASQFNQNGWGEGHERGVGLSAFSNNNISLLDVIAHDNYESGAYLDNWWDDSAGNIFVTSSEFMNNSLDTVWDGLVVLSNGDVTVQCSRFENNGGYGIYGELDGGTLTLNGNIFTNNDLGDTHLDGGTLVDNPGYICKVVSSSGKKSITSIGLPLNVIHVNGGEKNTLSCNGFSGTELILPNGDRVIIPCPNGDQASLDSVTNGELPGALDGNFTFISGLDASVESALIGSMTVSFVIPDGQQDAEFTILHWDGAKWEELGGYKSSDTFFKVQTGSTGIFVLASK